MLLIGYCNIMIFCKMNFDWSKELREMKFVSRSIRFVVYSSRCIFAEVIITLKPTADETSRFTERSTGSHPFLLMGGVGQRYRFYQLLSSFIVELKRAVFGMKSHANYSWLQELQLQRATKPESTPDACSEPPRHLMPAMPPDACHVTTALLRAKTFKLSNLLTFGSLFSRSVS